MNLKKIALSSAASLLVLVGAVTFLPLRAIAGLETPCNYISDLVATNPLSSDLASTGDDHLRCIKSVLKTTFPNINAAVTATDENLNALSASSTAAGILELEAAAPRLIVDETDAASNERIYDFASSAGQLLGRTRTDADAAGATWLTVDRTGTTVDSVALSASALSIAGATTYTTQGSSATPTILLNSAQPYMIFNESDAAADNRRWYWTAGGEAWEWGLLNDANSASAGVITVQRTGTTVDSINLQATAVQINGSTVTWGTYTPTITNGTNVASSTSDVCQYSRLGAVVTVSCGGVLIDPTSSATLTVFSVSLPVASNITASRQVGGGGVFGQDNGSVQNPLYIIGDATNDRAQMAFTSGTANQLGTSFTFTYLVN